MSPVSVRGNSVHYQHSEHWVLAAITTLLPLVILRSSSPLPAEPHIHSFESLVVLHKSGEDACDSQSLSHLPVPWMRGKQEKTQSGTLNVCGGIARLIILRIPPNRKEF